MTFSVKAFGQNMTFCLSISLYGMFCFFGMGCPLVEHLFNLLKQKIACFHVSIPDTKFHCTFH